MEIAREAGYISKGAAVCQSESVPKSKAFTEKAVRVAVKVDIWGGGPWTERKQQLVVKQSIV